MRSKTQSQDSFFSKNKEERDEQLRNVTMFLRSVVHYNPDDQSKGKPPKFRASDAMEVLITSGLVDHEEEAGLVIEELERESVISPSKGSSGPRSPKKVQERKFRFSEEVRKSEAGIIEGLDAVDVTGSPRKGGSQVVRIREEILEEGRWIRMLKLTVFATGVLLLLYPNTVVEGLAAVGAEATHESLKLVGSFILGSGIWGVLGAGGEGKGKVPGEGAAPGGQKTSSTGEESFSARDRARSRSVVSDPKVPVIDINDVPSVLKKVTEEMIPEFKWIDAGRSITGCKNALDAAGPQNSVVKRVMKEGVLESFEVTDALRRYPKTLKALGLLDKDDGWKLYKQGPTGTKVYSMYDDKGHFWIKVDGIFKGTPTTCTSIWKEGDLFDQWFPSVTWSKMLKKESDAEIVFTYGGNNPVGKSESILHGWGVNHLQEGFFLILGGSVKGWPGEDGEYKEFPKPPFRTMRNWVHDLSILVEPLGANAEGQQEVRNCLVSSLALPKLPTFIMEWILGKVFINLVDSMSECGHKCDAEGSETPHAKRNREDKFYSEFLTPRFNDLLDRKGLKR